MQRRFFISTALIPLLSGGSSMAGPTQAANDLFHVKRINTIGGAIRKYCGDGEAPGDLRAGFSTYVGQRTGASDLPMFERVTNPLAMHRDRIIDRATGHFKDGPARPVEGSSRLHDAIEAVKNTGRPHAIGTGSVADQGVRENEFEYGVLVRPNGTALFVVREHMGNQPMGPALMQKRNELLKQNGLPPLAGNAAGYHTIFALEIDASGNGTPVPTPANVDLSQFGISNPASGNLPRDPVPVNSTVAPNNLRPASLKLTT